MANMRLIQSVTVGAGGTANIEFTSIPQTYTDLVIKLSTNATTQTPRVRFNNSSSSIYSERLLYGQSGNAAGASNTNTTYFDWVALGNSSTSSFFGSSEFYIPNYTGSNNKSLSSDSVTEINSSSGDNLYLDAARWNSTAAITSILIYNDVGTFNQYSTAYLYGVTSADVGAKATGGIISQDDTYYYHTFLSSGVFTPTQSLTVDYLVVAGGGSSSGNSSQGTLTFWSGGGGAGGLRSTVGQTGGGGTLETPLSLSASAYTITVGAAGAWTTNGSNSSIAGSGITTVTSVGGGAGSPGGNGSVGNAGGSGGGGGGSPSAAGGAGTANQGYAGGTGGGSTQRGGGGGGAGSVGANGTAATSTAGGSGLTITMPASTTYATGGFGGDLGPSVPGTANTGNGGSYNNIGGSGIVVVRYAK